MNPTFIAQTTIYTFPTVALCGRECNISASGTTILPQAPVRPAQSWELPQEMTTAGILPFTPVLDAVHAPIVGIVVETSLGELAPDPPAKPDIVGG